MPTLIHGKKIFPHVPVADAKKVGGRWFRQFILYTLEQTAKGNIDNFRNLYCAEQHCEVHIKEINEYQQMPHEIHSLHDLCDCEH